MQTTGRALVFLRDAQAIVPFTVAKRNMEHVVLNAITIIAKWTLQAKYVNYAIFNRDSYLPLFLS